MEKKYILQEGINPDLSLQNFKWHYDSKHVTLAWDWPIEREIRFAIIFKCENEKPDLETLLLNKHPYEVVMRDLSSNYVTLTSEPRCKFLICPAYFNGDRTISICKPALVTDWVYKKFDVNAKAIYSPLQLSRYQKATLEINTNSDLHLLAQALTYAIYEDGQMLASYPLDSQLIVSGGCMYIQKNQKVEFKLHPDYKHLFQINE